MWVAVTGDLQSRMWEARRRAPGTMFRGDGEGRSERWAAIELSASSWKRRGDAIFARHGD